MDSLIVSEVFGPTFQGEGPSAGQRAMFLRLGLCNLSCSYCDTPYTWDWTGRNGEPQDRDALQHLPINEVVASGLLTRAPLLVITGGEPMLQRHSLDRLLKALPVTLEVEIETNGTLAPTETMIGDGVRFNVSPKLDFAEAGDTVIVPTSLRAFAQTGNAIFKFVCAERWHVDEVATIVDEYHIDPATVWIMPEGRSAEAITTGLQRLAGPALAAGYNLTSRLHVLVWGDERGR